ncbi:hypothetical protein COCSUDRAFT_64923 [Coccomyxa subellipsoidea C-169]|uniref:Right handed beta helix domain-containing protein n=1 Tax=Coccomyxa subellipsoidea (strain C-169) TaxID=574566 RepID=I0Z5Q7_COCSC|nr:hypothetical protein COCSUDRAFT_64923 [Coccomyxa subellipsoidea C-169]EIE25976.1 hypothetical protein COCSUDRAFT_64923 [Coccomyxa subellipsoidea C-169]|eukprot:XP_005650520.1 hypothetical protein COCSUDRAFT_64923 [Coccomyxa subellipsoidea C-169]
MHSRRGDVEMALLLCLVGFAAAQEPVLGNLELQGRRILQAPYSQTSTPYETACKLVAIGSSDGTGIADGSITCTGPGTPVMLSVSADLKRFSSKFTGVTTSDTVPSSAAILEISDTVNVAIVNSEMTGIPGNIHIRNSTVQILNGSFTLNSGGTAGAISIDSSRVLIDSSNFANNTGAAGGAIQVQGQSSVGVTDSTFLGNVNANSQGGALAVGPGALGGAVAAESTQSTIGGCIFSNNTAASQGGALYQSNTTGDVTTCTFSGNKAANGGALYQNLAQSNVIRTAFNENAASQKGGALFSTSSTGNIMNSTFTSNKAVQSGGGVFQNDCASSISFSIFSKNDGGSGGGGGIYRNACKGFTINCSYIENTSAQGGAIYQNNCISNNIRATVFNGNKAQQGSTLFLNNSVPAGLAHAWAAQHSVAYSLPQCVLLGRRCRRLPAVLIAHLAPAAGANLGPAK